jgi:hypothetical protein
MTTFWNTALYSLAVVDRRFRGSYIIVLTTEAVRTVKQRDCITAACHLRGTCLSVSLRN